MNAVRVHLNKIQIKSRLPGHHTLNSPAKRRLDSETRGCLNSYSYSPLMAQPLFPHLPMHPSNQTHAESAEFYTSFPPAPTCGLYYYERRPFAHCPLFYCIFCHRRLSNWQTHTTEKWGPSIRWQMFYCKFYAIHNHKCMLETDVLVMVVIIMCCANARTVYFGKPAQMRIPSVCSVKYESLC